jgi:hypothetical protein
MYNDLPHTGIGAAVLTLVAAIMSLVRWLLRISHGHFW